MKRTSLIEFVLLALVSSASAVAVADGVVSAAHPLASNTAEEIFALGGNAADASIAVSLVLSVVEPTLSGLGGSSTGIGSHTGWGLLRL